MAVGERGDVTVEVVNSGTKKRRRNGKFELDDDDDGTSWKFDDDDDEEDKKEGGDEGDGDSGNEDEKMASLLDELQVWRERNASSPYQAWDIDRKSEFDVSLFVGLEAQCRH